MSELLEDAFVAERSAWCRSNFKSLVEAATGIPIPHQKLFYGPGLLVLKDRSASVRRRERQVEVWSWILSLGWQINLGNFRCSSQASRRP